MLPSFEFWRDPNREFTKVTVSGRIGTLELCLHSKLSPKQRRNVIVSFLRLLGPFLRWFYFGEVWHSEDKTNHQIRSELRGVRLFPSARPDSETGLFGYEIRMRRLELDWSQSELARKAGLTQEHLSRLERGHCRPNAETRNALERALGSRLPKTAPGKKGEKVIMAHAEE